MKKKILVCSEATKIPSGFGVYNKRLLEALHKNPNYEVAEFATYGFIGDKEQFKIPWKYYPNAVQKGHPKFDEHNASPENQFGRWRFDRVLLDFKPDIVIDIRDYWMSYFQGNSPLRRYFKWFLMPTVDSSPQKEEWLDTYLNADLVFTYSDWGREVLAQQTSNTIKFAETVSPGVNLNEFKIENNKEDIKKALALDPEAIVLGTIMRNQKRKLYPELIRAFEKIIDKLSPEIAEKTILYLHTSYPDAGWDFIDLIKNSRVGNKIFFTYVCKNCGAVFASPFGDSLQPCYKCGQKSAMMPNVGNGLDTSVLAKVINTFSIYIQYAICEGFGMPQIEAAACGIPIATVDYSAMIDVINKLDATPIKVGSYFKELETSAIRVYPCETDTINKIVDLINMPNVMRNQIGLKTRHLAEEHYNWDSIIQTWTKYIDETPSTQDLWNSTTPLLLEKIDKTKIPKHNNAYELAYILYQTHLQRLNINIDSYWLLRNIQLLQRGFVFERNETRPFTIDNFIDIVNSIIENHNIAEMARVNSSILINEDYIDYANGVTNAPKN